MSKNFWKNCLGWMLPVCLVFWLMAYQALAANYYYANTAAGSEDASSCANADDIAGFNANAQSLQPGDFAYLCDTEVIRTQLTIPASGDGGSQLTIMNAPGDSPRLTGTEIISAGWSEYSAPSAEDFTDGTGDTPISYWLFEEASSPAYDANATSNNDLTWESSPAQSATHQEGSYSLYLSTTGKSAYSNDADLSANFPFAGATTDFTIGGWIYAPSAPASWGMFAYKSDYSSTGFQWMFSDTDLVYFKLYKSGGGNTTAYSNAAVSDEWVHVVARWAGSGDDALTLFIDGVAQTATGTTTAIALDTTNAFYIGKNSTYIDEWFVFDVALTNDQIADIATHGLAGDR